MKFLLDTNVVSEIQRGQPDVQVQRWFAGLDDEDLFLSVVVLSEIARGIEQLRPRDPSRAAGFDAWLHRLKSRYAGRIIEIDAEIGEIWGRLNGRMKSQGVAPQLVDNLLAASAISRGLVVATRNLKDFVHASVPLYDPWKQVFA